MTAHKPIPGALGYSASNDGQIVGPRGRTLRQRVRDGYRQVSICRTTRSVNRLIALAFHGEPPSPQHQAAHRNGVRSDNRAANLYWATPVQNCADRDAHGTTATGSRNGSAKLSETAVAEIRRARAKGARQQAIADRYGISQGLVSMILAGQYWRVG